MVMVNDSSIRLARREDRGSIRDVAVYSGLFSTDEVSLLEPMIDGYLDGSLDGHRWFVATLNDRVVAAAYYSPEPFSFRVANLYFLAALPSVQGTGVGTALLTHVEAALRELGADVAQTLIVETSSADRFAATREFYRARGFTEEATIRRFYGPAEHKVVFWKSLIDESVSASVCGSGPR